MRQLLVAVGILGFAGVTTLTTGCGDKATSGGTPSSKAAADANLTASAEVKGIGICCGKCAANVQEVLGKVDGVGAVTCDVDKHLVAFKAKDGKAATAAWDALKSAGYAGEFTQEGGFQSPGMPLIMVPGKVKEVTIKNVHVCCGGCEKAIKGAIKDGEVSFEGSGPQKTVRITGNELDVNGVTGALWKAGYSGQVDFKK